MKRQDILTHILTPLGEAILLGFFFLFTYWMRQFTDGIPFVQLRIPYIRFDQYLPFVGTGILLWWIIFSNRGHYREWQRFSHISSWVRYLHTSTLWFLIYIGFIYLTTGFLFSKEIPRLIVIYVWIFSTITIPLFHILIGVYHRYARSRKRDTLPELFLARESQIEIGEIGFPYLIQKGSYIDDLDRLCSDIRERRYEIIIGPITDDDASQKIRELARIYGVRYFYPKHLQNIQLSHQEDTFIAGIAMIETHSISITPIERIIKRTIDIIGASLGLILLSPFLGIISILIKWEDPDGPILYKNKRIGLNGKEFDLLKFRYMYWKYCIKESYGVDKENDSALQYEESLKKVADTRKGPLYKIANDPRKTKIGSWIEKFSIDELPQLWNVLLGDMSLIGPRPHQPREVALYEEYQYQVLIVKPGVTGMAQVHGREKNRFEDEVRYDTYYIENYSLLLDITIFLRTLVVIFERALHRKTGKNEK